MNTRVLFTEPARHRSVLVERWFVALSLLVSLPSILCARGFAQTDMVIYSDALTPGWFDYPMAKVDYANSSPVHSGSKSISVSAKAQEGIVIAHGDLDTTFYSDLSFWIHGGSAGGQLLQVMTVVRMQPRPPVALDPLPAGQWRHVTIPLADLGVAHEAGLNGFALVDRSGTEQPPFYLDDISLVATALPTMPQTVHVQVDGTHPIRTVDPRVFGVNAAIWDRLFDTPETVSLLQAMDNQVLRFPGGSLSDEYHWASNTTGSNTWAWATSFDRFAHVATQTRAQVFVTANYGTGTADEAAAWVQYSNVTQKYGFKYWEIGNENYGSWEADAQGRPHDPYTYATRAADYYAQMKAVDPSIKIGVVVLPGEDTSFVPYADHPAVNPRTGTPHTGWTPVVLATLRRLGVTPDFVIHHRYAQQPGGESDFHLLQSAHTWRNDANDLRQQLADYLGPEGASVELVCTEHNSVSSQPGKQTTSLVNGLFLADSFGQALQTEFNAVVWWDLRNGQEFGGNNDAAFYGWRACGDYGMVSPSNSCYPTFFVSKLLQYFARGGDQILPATSDSLLLSAYAARRTDGSLALLFVNKSASQEAWSEVQVGASEARRDATVYSYGIPQDEAARMEHGSGDIAQTHLGPVDATFTYVLPPYSATVVVLAPAR
jgi:alpha-N-arabinofuranosidase